MPSVSPTGPNDITLALDAMGGDHAPTAVLEGAELFLKRHKGTQIRFLLFGNRAVLAPALKKHKRLRANCEIKHTEIKVASDEKPSNAIRRGRNSSMGKAIQAVRRGEADAAVSGGNTGALMALSKILLQTLPGVERPAIGGIMPSVRRPCVMLDMGANVTSDANNLFEFAVMGHAFSRALFNIENPTIGLMNVGSEEMKGHEAVKSAATLIKESDLPLEFYGYVEGDDVAGGAVDVVVTDGFTGNVALKSAEGTARMCGRFLFEGLKSNPLGWIAGLLAYPAINQAKNRLDPRKLNGAMFLGLNGIVIKSHGGMDARGFSYAIDVAYEMVSHNINEQIIREMMESGHIPPEDELTTDVAENPQEVYVAEEALQGDELSEAEKEPAT